VGGLALIVMAMGLALGCNRGLPFAPTDLATSLDVDLTVSRCGDGGSCPQGFLCYSDKCLFDPPPCAIDDDCVGDTYCTCGGSSGGPACTGGLCVPWGLRPRGSWQACGGFELTVDANNIIYCGSVWAMVCNRGDRPAPVVGSFYDRDPRLAGPPGPNVKPRLLCTVTNGGALLAPGECGTTMECRNLEDPQWPGPPESPHDYHEVWFRANDDGLHFPAAAECDPGNDVVWFREDCTLL
jgi:hypothetical protein